MEILINSLFYYIRQNKKGYFYTLLYIFSGVLVGVFIGKGIDTQTYICLIKKVSLGDSVLFTFILRSLMPLAIIIFSFNVHRHYSIIYLCYGIVFAQALYIGYESTALIVYGGFVSILNFIIISVPCGICCLFASSVLLCHTSETALFARKCNYVNRDIVFACSLIFLISNAVFYLFVLGILGFIF